MGEQRNYKAYTNEQRLSAVKKIKNRGDIAAVSKKIGIEYTTLQGWYTRYMAYGEEDFVDKTPLRGNASAALNSLEARVARIETELGLTSKDGV